MMEKYGLPLVSQGNLFDLLQDSGIRPWEQTQPPMDLQEYERGDRTPEERDELSRFAPKGQVVFLRNPKGGVFRGFRSTLRDWASTFALTPEGLLPVVAEYKHGAHVVSIGLPSGVPARSEMELPNPMALVARREFEEETGLILESVEGLGHRYGVVVSSRNNTQKFFAFLGHLQDPVATKPTRHDTTEVLRTLLVPIEEWLSLLEGKEIPEGYFIEVSARDATYLALRRLDKLKLT